MSTQQRLLLGSGVQSARSTPGGGEAASTMTGAPAAPPSLTVRPWGRVYTGWRSGGHWSLASAPCVAGVASEAAGGGGEVSLKEAVPPSRHASIATPSWAERITQNQHIIYTLSTEYLHSIYTVSTQYLQSMQISTRHCSPC